MEKIKVTKGQVLHKRGDEVRLIEIVLSGGLLMTDGHDVEVRLGSGAVAGAVYSPGEEYDFDYVASEDSTLITMEYNADEDLAEAVTSTAAIAPAMAAASMEHTSGVLDALVSIEEAATELCKEIRYNYNDYKFLCRKYRHRRRPLQRRRNRPRQTIFCNSQPAHNNCASAHRLNLKRGSTRLHGICRVPAHEAL